MRKSFDHHRECNVRIAGQDAFVRKTMEALDLISTHPLQDLVKRFVFSIEEWKRSEMRADQKYPTFRVGERTWRAPVDWYSGAIVHDAYHSNLYYDNHIQLGVFSFTFPRKWKGRAVEIACIRIQLSFLRDVGADPRMLTYLERLETNPTYVDVPRRDRTW